jgi:hypothetical protein
VKRYFFTGAVTAGAGLAGAGALVLLPPDIANTAITAMTTTAIMMLRLFNSDPMGISFV